MFFPRWLSPSRIPLHAAPCIRQEILELKEELADGGSRSPGEVVG